MNIIKKALLLSVLLSFPFFTFALAPNARGMGPSIQKDIIQRTEQIRTEAQKRIEQLQSIGRKEGDVEEIRARIEEHKSEILERSAGIKEEVSGRIEILKGREENNLRVPEMVRERMSQLAQERAGNLAQRVSSMNLRFSEAYFQMLDRTEGLINRMEERTKRLEELLNVDLTDVYLKLTKAREQIDAAREVISAQLKEEYEVSAESMEEMGNAFRETMTRMQSTHRELRSSFIVPIRNTIRDAHLALKEAISEQRDSAENENEEEEKENEDEE